MLHCMNKCGLLIDLCPLGEGIECLTLVPTLADHIQATTCMLDKSCRAWVLSSSNLEIIVADLGVIPWVCGWVVGGGFEQK